MLSPTLRCVHFFGGRSRAIQFLKANKDFDTSNNINDVEAIPIIHISQIKPKKIEYLIQSIWLTKAVGFISGQPGISKTWFAWEMGISIATGTKAFGVFETKKGKVIAFNAEDDQETITKQRLEGFCRARGLTSKDADFYLINVPFIDLSDEKIKNSIEKRIDLEKPALVIFDPFRNVHTRDEDSSTEIIPILDYLRKLSRVYKCSVLLVCHDRKPQKNEANRQSLTRGSNAQQGWRDTAIYLDKTSNEGLVKVSLYHRGAPAVNPFYFELKVESSNDVILNAALHFVPGEEVKNIKEFDLGLEIIHLLKKAPLPKDCIPEKIGKKRQEVLDQIKLMLAIGELEEFKIPGKRGKFIRFREPGEPGTSLLGSGSPP